MDGTLATLGSLVLSVALAAAGASPSGASRGGGGAQAAGSPAAAPQRVLVAVPDDGLPLAPSTLAALETRLHIADPAATSIVMLPPASAQTVGVIHLRVKQDQASTHPDLWIEIDDAVSLRIPLEPIARTPGSRDEQVHVVEVMGDSTGILAERVGQLGLTLDELRLPTWQLPGGDAVAIDGAWWSMGLGRNTAASAPVVGDGLRARLGRRPVSAMRRLMDVSVGDVTGDGVPVVAVSFRRPFHRTLLNASEPRQFWTDPNGLSAHVGLYRASDLSEIWVAGTLVRPIRRLAACTGIMTVAYSTLEESAIVATSAWRWQGFAFLPLPDLEGRGRPTCIDIDGDGRTEAAVIGRG